MRQGYGWKARRRTLRFTAGKKFFAEFFFFVKFLKDVKVGLILENAGSI